MAKRKVNKSQAVRDMLAAGTGSPKEIAATLTKRGVKVSAAYVSNIKTQMSKKTPGGLRGRPRKASYNGNGSSGSDVMIEAVDLVLHIGAQEAHKLIDVADQMISRVSSKRV